MRLRILRTILIASAVLSIGCASQEDDIPIAEIEEALGFFYVPDYIPDSFAFGGVEVNDREGIIPYKWGVWAYTAIYRVSTVSQSVRYKHLYPGAC